MEGWRDGWMNGYVSMRVWVGGCASGEGARERDRGTGRTDDSDAGSSTSASGTEEITQTAHYFHRQACP